ncbi:MAG: cupin domain-containing protein [Bacteroidia bacterium]|nr:cupin domain-containing protein [Bacteroidia bacterium]
MNTININQKLSLFSDHWHPRIIGELNGQEVKAVKLLGDFPWHHHDHEDEMFLVIRGRLTMRFRNKTEIISAGEFIIVPRGVEHQPYAEQEVELLLFEPSGTVNTGNVVSEKTRTQLEKI